MSQDALQQDRLLVEESHDLPLVHFQVVIPSGSIEDPQGREGLTRLTARLLRRGTLRRSTRDIEETIDALGAELSLETSPGFVRLSGSTIERSLEPILALAGELLSEPSLPEDELSQLKRETEAALLELTDSDQALAGMHFRRALFRGHPYGRPSLGTRSTLRGIDIDQVTARYREGLSSRPRLIAMAGAITPARGEMLARKYLLSRSDARPLVLPPEPTMPTGRHLRVVDKPERTQTQIQIGRLASHPHDDDHVALLVGNAVFGGAFTARLMRAVRSERGWSYGASSRVALDRVREAWNMWTFPAATDAVACIALQLALMEEWVDKGIDEKELAFAKSYMIKSHAFSIDTADKRLEQAIEVLLYDLPTDYYTGFTQHVEAVTLEQVNAALKQRLSPRDLIVSVVATDAELGDALRTELAPSSHEVVKYDADAT
ncbi:MAG: pitrilysin family protein [Polyangiales bacterium]